ncbi:MAG TPA: NFACT family protein [Pyrinomonadaceae bacterium]|nr:NFACT family protein [Pyrinomonadaceae bacterium]
MNDRLIAEVVEELAAALVGRAWGRVFQLSAASLAVDFRAADGRYLFVSVEPNRPRLYLVSRAVRELERASVAPAPFALVLRKALGGAVLESVTKDEGDRVVRLLFSARDALGGVRAATLVAQLTGRTSNLFLLDEKARVLDALRHARGEGQEVGDAYRPPAGGSARAAQKDLPDPRGDSPSEALDRYYLRAERERAFDARAAAASARLRQEAARLAKLRDNLARDLAAHGDAEAHKRAGDLLLANLGTAERRGRVVRLTDFYAEGAPTVEVEVEENRTLQEAAAERFARYGKAKRAAREITERLAGVGRELAALDARRAELERITAARDEEALAAFVGAPAGGEKAKGTRRAKAAARGEPGAVPGVRRYRSSDGLEILVGRGSRDNDHLTFRVARSFDTWLHAADYPGSHVVVRAPRRDAPVPHRTLVEAAQLAAHFSRAKKDSKVAVNYTQRKFVSKPKGAAPGLVYLSSFRTLLVEPREEVERI